MARLQSVSKTAGAAWDEYKGWLFLGASVYALYSFRGVFAAVGGAANSGAGALLSGVTEKAQAAADKQKAAAKVQQDKAKAKAAVGGATSFTDDEINQFAADAESLRTFLGRGEGFGLQNVFKDEAAAFSLIKQRYSRLNLYNNKPFKHGKTAAGKATIVPQTVETKDSVKNRINWKVLVAPYKEATGGHDLQADLRYYITNADRRKLFKWIL